MTYFYQNMTAGNISPSTMSFILLPQLPFLRDFHLIRTILAITDCQFCALHASFVSNVILFTSLHNVPFPLRTSSLKSICYSRYIGTIRYIIDRHTIKPRIRPLKFLRSTYRRYMSRLKLLKA